MKYNLIIIEDKCITDYLNLTKSEFFETLWEWTYEYDLWDFIEEEDPDEESLNEYLCNIFIDDNIFHRYCEDDTNCYAFVVDDGKVSTYHWNQDLLNFIYDKIKDYREQPNPTNS